MAVETLYSTLRTEIAGVPVGDLAARFGTPTFVYDAASIERRISALSDFDVVRYAQKANSNLAILDLCRRAGVQLDATSSGEIHRALHAGYEPHGEPAPIIYTADIFDRDSLDLVVEQGIHVNCGSPDMIDQLGQRTPGVGITLRINPGFGHGHSQKTNTGGEHSKHGIWHTDVANCLERAAKYDLTISGLHMHIGSGTDLEHLSQVCGALEKGQYTFSLVDAGFNNLARPVMYGAYHPMSIAPAASRGEQPTQPVVVGGPLCESGDIFTQQEGGYVCTRELPVAEVGDWLVIHCAGAYGFAMGSNYNSKPLAAEVLIKDGVAHQVRARQTFEDLIRGESKLKGEE